MIMLIGLDACSKRELKSDPLLRRPIIFHSLGLCGDYGSHELGIASYHRRVPPDGFNPNFVITRAHRCRSGISSFPNYHDTVPPSRRSPDRTPYLSLKLQPHCSFLKVELIPLESVHFLQTISFFTRTSSR